MKLNLELLENRCLLTVLRLVSWNTENNPDNVAEDADFATILAAIGNETVQGNTTRIDLLALQETDLPGSGLDSMGRIESILETLYPGVDYKADVSSLDGGGDATGFVYDTTTLNLLESSEFSAGLTHTALRGKFRPTGSAGDADFYVYSSHLKAGTSASDAAQRASETSILRANADALGEGANVILAGDLNLQSSFETSYVNLTAAGAAQLSDPIATPGTWHDNSAFRSVHTQNPRDPNLGGGGVDDRFDFQLVSDEFFDSVGIDYIPESYRAFGNNGTHSLNDSITSGSGASPDVLAALAIASDHLPVVADYDVLDLTPGVTVRQSGGSTKIFEGGVFDTYSVVLDSVPTSNVSVTVDPDEQTDVGAGPGTPISLLFTPLTAITAQTVVVTAADDADLEGTHTSVISHSSLSTDADYQGLSLEQVTAMVIDDDAPTIVINELDADTSSIDMLEFVELYDGGVGNVALSGLTVVFYNGATDASYAAFDLDGFTTSGDGFFLLGNSAVDADITFNDNFLQNGPDAVALFMADASAFPNGTGVTLTGLLDAVVYDTDDADDVGLLPLLLPSQPQVNEDENNNKVLDSVSRTPDGGNPRETANSVAQLPTPGALNSPPTAGVLIVQSGGRTDIGENGLTDSYTLELTTFPTEEVTITVSPDAQIDLGNGPGNSITLTFTQADAIIPQTIIVTAVDDVIVEGPHVSTITHSVGSLDPDFDGISLGSVVVNIVDDEPPPIISVVITEIMYNPNSDENAPGVGEWIELVNNGNNPLDLVGWMFDDEDTTGWGAIPGGVVLGVNQVAIFYDELFATESQFRAAWSVPSSALVVGLPWGSLANSPSSTNEILRLLDNLGSVQDEVNYDDSGDWPSDNPDGPSIYLLDVAADNNVGTHWARSSVGADAAVVPDSPFSIGDVGSPGRFDVALADGDFDDDGDYDCDDIDALVAELALATANLAFDLTGDDLLDINDLAAWLEEAGEINLGPAKSYLMGDATLDGFVDGQDFIAWNTHKFSSTAAWCHGDFNADGSVNGQDFLVWNANKFQSSDALVRLAPNPEDLHPESRPSDADVRTSAVDRQPQLVARVLLPFMGRVLWRADSTNDDERTEEDRFHHAWDALVQPLVVAHPPWWTTV